MNDDWIENYLGMLGIERGLPTFATLQELAGAHRQILFANGRSLIRKAGTPEGDVREFQVDDLLGSWRAQGTGDGVCYEVATMVEALLTGLGFENHVILGNVVGPRSHSANVVSLDGREFMLDLGNGAPLFEPIPMDEACEIEFAGLGYRFDRQGPQQQLVQSRFIEGEWRPFVRYDSGPATAEERVDAFQMHHVLPAISFVMSTFTLVQTRPGEVLALRDHTFTHYRSSGKTSREVSGMDAYRGLVRDGFGLANYPIDDALRAWSQVTGATI